MMLGGRGGGASGLNFGIGGGGASPPDDAATFFFGGGSVGRGGGRSVVTGSTV